MISKILHFKGDAISGRECLLYFGLVWSFLRFSFTDGEKNFWHFTESINGLTYFIDPLITIAMLASFIYSITLFKALKTVYILIFLLITAFILAVISNLEVVIFSNLIKFFVGYFKFIIIIFFTSLLHQKSPLVIQRILYLTLGCLFFQIIVNTTWYLDLQLFKNPKIEIPNNQDWAYGSMENTHTLAVTFVIMFAFCVFWIIKYPAGKKIGIILLVISTIQIVWAESKVNFLLISISLLISTFFILNRKQFIISSIIISFLFVSFFSVSAIVYANSSHFVYGNAFEIIKGLSGVIMKSFEYNFKLIYLKELLFEIPKDQFIPLFGSGPGVLGSNFAYENPTTISNKYFVPLVDQNYNLGNSTLMSPRIGVFSIYSDLGPVGFLLYFFIHYHFFITISRGLKTFYGENLILDLARFIWVSLMINFLLNQFFIDILYVGSPMVIIWSLGTLLYIDTKLKLSRGEDA